MKTLNLRITGVTDLLMHNGQTADPLNEFSRAIKAISSKRAKTDEDFEEMARLEYSAGLYLDKKGRPCIPGEVLEAAIFGRGGAARKARAGKQAQAAMFIDGSFPLEYEGAKDVEEMWKDESLRHVTAVRVQANKVMRTRPRIPAPWSAEVTVSYNEKLLNERDIVEWFHTCGEEVGLMDWRPRYGRFSVEVLNGK